MFHTHRRRPRSEAIALLILLLLWGGLAVCPADATLTDIINVTGANDAIITDTPPDPVTTNPNDGILLAWDERQNVTLTSDLRVDRVFDSNAPFVEPDGSKWIIKAGTIVSSHYLQWDPGNGSDSRVEATIQLDSQVFAFITADQKLFESDLILGRPGLDYNDFSLRGLESGDTTEFNGPDVDVSWSASSPGDWTRLLTAFSPAASAELTTQGQPNAPAEVAFGPVRVGTSASATLSVTNTGGDEPAGLEGTAPSPSAGDFALVSPAAFGPLAPDAEALFTYSYAPTQRGDDAQGIGSIATNDTDGAGDLDAPVSLVGRGVGPVAAVEADEQPVASGDTIDIGPIDADQTVLVDLLLANVSDDDDGGLSELTDLTLTGALLSGNDASAFRLEGFSAGTVISRGGETTIGLRFDPAGVIDLFDDATLTLQTDENAALGGDGRDIILQLQAVSVPEPASLALILAGGATLLARRARPGT